MTETLPAAGTFLIMRANEEWAVTRGTHEELTWLMRHQVDPIQGGTWTFREVPDAGTADRLLAYQKKLGTLDGFWSWNR